MVRTWFFEAGGDDFDMIDLFAAASYGQLAAGVVRLTEVLTTEWTFSSSLRPHTGRYTQTYV